MDNATVKKHREPLIHIAKRESIAGWKAWLIRLGAIVLGVLVLGYFLGRQLL